MQKIVISLALAVLMFAASFLPTLAKVTREGLFDRASRTVDALVFIRSELDDRYQTFLNAQGEAERIIQEILAPLELKINTLTEQLSIFDENIRREKINLAAAQQDSKAVQLELADLAELAEMREVELARSRDLLDEFIRLAYSETMRYTDWQTGEISALKFLLSDDSLANLETERGYLDVLQNVSASLILDLQSKQTELSAASNRLLAKRGELILRQQDIIDRKARLEQFQAAKQHLLNQTRGQEYEYRKLVEESRKQQVEALSDIKELKSQMGVIDKQLKTIKGDLSEDDFAKLLQEQSVASLSGMIFPDRIPRLIWPANPGRGITAYFHDENYKKVFGMTHYAIDFRLAQGSRVNSAGPGIVYKVKDNGLGYSYIMIAHPGGLATLYGHIGKMMVAEGDLVKAGQIIGLSGGMPGTRGAGYITTGPHLHLEVLENGEQKNPLDFLPLESLRLEDIPEEYTKDAMKL
ncbi:MAG: peptidoglycan DD-metalloendopeptidase family protein [Patescibacteria group bacterium]